MTDFEIMDGKSDELIEKLLIRLNLEYDDVEELPSYITIQREWEYSLDKYTHELKKTDIYVLYIAKEETHPMPREFGSIKEMEAFIEYLLIKKQGEE
tara:strand:- start:417 stop:707 length:291 start_codon:yes stop_codon:yes gene_type:complete